LNLDRRSLLAGATALAAWPAPALSAPRYKWPLGVQLWSVDEELRRDFSGTLAALARLGFREVETAGLHGHSPRAFRAAAARSGLQLASAHYSMADLFSDTPRCIAEARALGVRWLVASSPRPDAPLAPGDWLTAMRQAMTAAAWRRNALKLNKIGRLARAAGLRFAYHNHPFEFDRYEGRSGFDLLLEGTAPALVSLELDVAWAVAGGADPVALLREHRGRIRLLHVKGLKARPAPGSYGTDFRTGVVGVGDVVDWRAVFAAATRAGVAHAFVEQEPPHLRPILQSLAACRDQLLRI